ncbi:hypothetical protein N1851_023176 [Merluccius polli]|uniref:DDE Tnp4 domain-containing protein n=1 Tax=Merluccius polli TaxID=89951 RepID=A0AA47MGT2_MERPO|nr:hypothetical protein N1851_032907 [Merluccius polli]KAK0139900.1 hypothetical protein N1851_023176 [Merluccius polli]
MGADRFMHVVIQTPNNSRSLFYNYKGTFSIVLLAVVDAKYCFRVVDVGGYGRTSDGRTLVNSTFGQALRDGTLSIPERCHASRSRVPGTQTPCFCGRRGLSPPETS